MRLYKNYIIKKNKKMLAKFYFFSIIRNRKDDKRVNILFMKKLLFLICLFSLSLYSCAIRNSLAPKREDLDAERTFIAQRINNGASAGYFDIPTKLVKTTDHLAIYLQTTYSQGMSAYGLNKMAQEFDYYYDDMTNIYGEHSDIDGNGKIIIVLVDINVKKSGSQTLGYFNPSDMYGGNKGEVLYMDLSNANYSIDKSIGTLIHEFQHLINYSYVVSGKRKELSSWLNESLSESTSILFNKTTAESRMREFTNINYYCFYTWDIPINVSNYNGSNRFSNGLVNYPSSSVFMHWLYNKNGNKSDIFKKIAESKQNADYMKVLKAAQEISDLSGISDWGDLLLTWMSNISADGICPNWNTNFKVTNNLAQGATTLYPGAMIVCDSYASPSTGINNFITRTNSNGKIIHLNKDTTLKDYASVNTSGVNSAVSEESQARQSFIETEKEEKNQIINILLDRNGNIKKY